MSREDLAWAAGLFDGEGCVTALRRRFPNGAPRKVGISVKVLMTDREPLDRLCEAIGLGKVFGPYQPSGHGKRPRFTWSVQTFQESQAAIAMMWPWPTTAKKEKYVRVAREVLG